jgi:hypothetical protein
MLPVSLYCSLLIVPSVYSSVYFVLCLVYPMLTVSLCCSFLIVPSVYSSVYFVLCIRCWQFLCVVHSWLSLLFTLVFILSCVYDVDSVSVLFILDFPSVYSSVYFVLCLVYTMLTVSLCCSFLIVPSVYSSVYFVLCIRCCQCLCVVHSWLPLLFTLVLICPVSCVSDVASVSVLFIINCPFCLL